MTEFLIGVVAAALVNDWILTRFSGGESPDTLERLKRAAMLGGFSVLVTLKACGVAFVFYYGVLSPLGMGAAWVPLCFLAAFGSAWALGRVFRNGAGTLATYWPLTALNAVAFGAAAHGVGTGAGFAASLLSAFAASALFAVALVSLTAIQARMDVEALPESVRGVPTLLLSAALVSMALMAFAGL